MSLRLDQGDHGPSPATVLVTSGHVNWDGCYIALTAEKTVLHPSHTCRNPWVHPTDVSWYLLVLMLTSQQKSSVFSSPAACRRSPLIEHQRNCSMSLFESTTIVEFSFFFFSQCYSCSNKHWLLTMQVLQLHSLPCALICLLSGSCCWSPSGCHWTQDHVTGHRTILCFLTGFCKDDCF